MLDVYELNFDKSFIKKAEKLFLKLENLFTNKNHMYSFSSDDIFSRQIELLDGNYKSANCLIAELKIKMYYYTGNQKYKDHSDSMMNSVAKSALKFPTSFSSWIGAIMNNYYGIKEISILGNDFQEASNKLLQNFIPSLILMSSRNPDKDFPLLNKPENSLTMIYVCENFSCRSPMEINDDFINAILN